MKNRPSGCAVIEIGSNNVKMGIFQSAKGEVSCLDRLNYPVNLGHEIFNFGRVTFSSLNELSEILDKYTSACKGFGTEDIYVVSTTVMREAGNSDLIADRIKTLNGLSIHVLSDNEEKSLIYADIIRKLSDYPEKLTRAAIAYVGSGSIGIACMNGGDVTRSFSVPLGALKLHDILGSLQREMSDYHLVVEEYLHSVFRKIELDDCDCLVFTGTEIERIAKLCGAEQKNGLPQLSISALKTLYKNIRTLTAENIAARYNMDEETANMFSTALSIFHELLRFTGKPSRVFVPQVDMEQILANHMLLPSAEAFYLRHIRDSALKSARLTAKKYNCNEVHYEAVARMVCQIFDKLKKVHGLDDSYRHILEVAAILHSCGQYVNVKQRTKCSFDLIKNMDIYGMSREDTLLAAFISGYNEFNAPGSDDTNYRVLPGEQRIITAKLVAMFRLANALDKSQKNKITLEKLKVEGDVLQIRASTTQNAFLEQWAFQECADFFLEIFGIRPQLIIKSNLI